MIGPELVPVDLEIDAGSLTRDRREAPVEVVGQEARIVMLGSKISRWDIQEDRAKAVLPTADDKA